MKIIAVSNHNSETQSDRLVAENIRSEVEAEKIADGLNDSVTDNSPDFYRAVPDEYKLYIWEP